MNIRNHDPRNLNIEPVLLVLANTLLPREISKKWSTVLSDGQYRQLAINSGLCNHPCQRNSVVHDGALETIYFPNIGTLSITEDTLIFKLDWSGIRYELSDAIHKTVGAVEFGKHYHMHSRGLKGDARNICRLLGIDGFVYVSKRHDCCSIVEREELLQEEPDTDLMVTSMVNFYGLTAIVNTIELLAPQSLVERKYFLV